LLNYIILIKTNAFYQTAKCVPDDGSDNLDELVRALPIDYSCRFNDICWSQGGVGYGWWPACIFNPCLAIGAARTQAKKNLGRRHLVYVSNVLMLLLLVVAVIVVFVLGFLPCVVLFG